MKVERKGEHSASDLQGSLHIEVFKFDFESADRLHALNTFTPRINTQLVELDALLSLPKSITDTVAAT